MLSRPVSRCPALAADFCAIPPGDHYAGWRAAPLRRGSRRHAICPPAVSMGDRLTRYCPECKREVGPEHKRVAVVMVTTSDMTTIWAEADATPLPTSRQSVAIYHKDCFERWHLHQYGRRPRLRRHFLTRMYEDHCRAAHTLRAA